jgi:hypothetical protein
VSSDGPCLPPGLQWFPCPAYDPARSLSPRLIGRLPTPTDWSRPLRLLSPSWCNAEDDKCDYIDQANM